MSKKLLHTVVASACHSVHNIRYKCVESRRLMSRMLPVTLAAMTLLQGKSFAQPVWTGGVAGIESLLTPAASDTYRFEGGNLFLHSVGWNPLSLAQKKNIVANFSGRSAIAEIGFKAAQIDDYVRMLKNNYSAAGVRPVLITCNAFALGNVPTYAEWVSFVNGVKPQMPTSRFVPTFEWANSRGGQIIEGNYISKNPENSLTRSFKQMILFNRGCTIDVPPAYYFNRKEGGAAYRLWVKDCIRWCKANGCTVHCMLSPHDSGANFDEDTKRFVADLVNDGAIPTGWIVSNYAANAGPNYPNIVGNEDVAHHCLGVGLWFARR